MKTRDFVRRKLWPDTTPATLHEVLIPLTVTSANVVP